MDTNTVESKTPDGERRYITRQQAAEMLGVTPRCLTNWMHRKILPYYRLGRMVRFDPQMIREHLDANFKFDKR